MAFMFEKLEVYQKAVDFADEIAAMAEGFPRGYGYLVDQLNRAALSIATNLAEGNGRFTKPDRRNFFTIARGSAQECVPLLASVPCECLNGRQHWILEQLRAGVELQRRDIEKRFGIKDKKAKRDLSDLVGRGLIVFERTPRPGHYRLVTKEAQAVRRIRSRNNESCSVGSENASTKPCNEGSNERQLTRFLLGPTKWPSVTCSFKSALFAAFERESLKSLPASADSTFARKSLTTPRAAATFTFDNRLRAGAQSSF